MIRPLIDAFNDYKLNLLPESNPLFRYCNKHTYHEACAIAGADQIALALDENPHLTLSQAISDWNQHSHPDQTATTKADPAQAGSVYGGGNYRPKMEDLFKSSHKAYFLKREEEEQEAKGSQQQESNWMGVSQGNSGYYKQSKEHSSGQGYSSNKYQQEAYFIKGDYSSYGSGSKGYEGNKYKSYNDRY